MKAVAYCPSILITGGSNFPVRRKEKQNRMREHHMEAYYELEGLVRKMETIGTGGIQSNDERAVEKLEKKLAEMIEAHEIMKEANAYYRRHKTLEGCPAVSEETARKIVETMKRSWRNSPVPFEPFELSNSNANIHRVQQRIEELKKIKARESTEREVDGIKIVENTEAMRIQLFFDGKPEPEVRNILKGNGFRWAPSAGAWQRQLNGNGRYAAEAALKEIQRLQTA